MATTSMGFRIGEGWDIHILVENRPLILGGINIPYAKGLAGHSDADALLHAITDSLIGAAALGDIGQHFSDQDDKYKNIDSKILLKNIVVLLNQKGWAIGNIDSTIIAQAPKLASYIPQMREVIAALLDISTEEINIKAKTAEKMGPVGRGEAIEARAVSLIVKIAK